MSQMELKNRIVVVSQKNMDALVSLYGRCSIDELEHIVNNIIDNAVAEIREDEGRLHITHQEVAKAQNCAECNFMKMYDYGNKIYYCDHVDRIDEMGKLGVGDVPRVCPVWCPLK